MKNLSKEEQAYRRGAHQAVGWLTYEIAVLDLTPTQFYEYLDRARDEMRRMRHLQEDIPFFLNEFQKRMRDYCVFRQWLKKEDRQQLDGDILRKIVGIE